MEYSHPDYPNIVVNPDICFGKPSIRGTRMPVSSVLAYLSSGMSIDEFVGEFNWISKEAVLESLAYASLQLEESFIPLQKAS